MSLIGEPEVPLPIAFNSDGFYLEQVERKGDLAIYTQNKFDRVIAWEVVKIRHQPAKLLPNGRVIPARESYPAPSDWGKYAWSCSSLARAREKLSELESVATNRAGSDGGKDI